MGVWTYLLRYSALEQPARDDRVLDRLHMTAFWLVGPGLDRALQQRIAAGHVAY
jgi:hypothetical protein